MTIDLSLKSVCNLLSDDAPELLKDINDLTNLVLLLSPLVFATPIGGAAAAISIAADLLAVKTEAFRVGQRLFEKVARKGEESSLSKQQRMEAAYCLVAYTAFFEALEELAPKLIKAIKLQPDEKLKLSKTALDRLKRHERSAVDTLADIAECGLMDFRLSFPHPAEDFEVQKSQLTTLYRELAKGFLAFVEGLQVWELADDRQRSTVADKANSLPELALKYFDAQYYVLATKFEDFFVWSNLFEHKKTRASLRGMSAYVKKYAALTQASKKTIDRGFSELARVIRLIPEQVAAIQPSSALAELERLYQSVIEEPILQDATSSEVDQPALMYPKKSEIFIPQSFKVLRFTQQVQLENERTWSRLRARNDLGPFLLSYLSSPYSTHTPLIILGHPGSGKSLLTSVLSARLISPAFTPIRVELRHINAENEIAVQIEEQISKSTNREITWASLSDHLDERPPLVLLDGYDELLQASGKVFSGYLMTTQKFQQNEARLGRKPVRAIVTSRITLIDKAQIPPGATIIRLLEFEEERRNQWITTWNSTNRHYFSAKNIQPFELPQADEKLSSLAGQPLLLLMLALYDSQDNQLRKTGRLDLTVLYENLLRRFIERERLKDDEFASLKRLDQEEEIDRDMERLGVAAVGMFNRRALHITSTELNADLSHFRRERQTGEASGRTLSQADLLLGSFFFVYQSESARKGNNAQGRDVDAAFEFLHNTFGEFLTADFILRTILRETNTLRAIKGNEALKALLAQKQEDPIAFPLEWFACLTHSPLFSRPAILNMLREWLRHKQPNVEEFIDDVDMIVTQQIKLVLSGTNFSPVIPSGGSAPFRQLPLVGHAAIYTLNLILLRTVLSSKDYPFDESVIPASDDGARAWDRLTHLWRSWFSLESLNGLTAIYSATRTDSTVYLQAKDAFTTSPTGSRIDSILSVSLTLADNITSGLAGIITYDSSRRGSLDLESIAARLAMEHIELPLQLLTVQLREARNQGSDRQRLASLLSRSVMTLTGFLIDSISYRSGFEAATLLASEAVTCLKHIEGAALERRERSELAFSIERALVFLNRFMDLEYERLLKHEMEAYINQVLDLTLALLELQSLLERQSIVLLGYPDFLPTFVESRSARSVEIATKLFDLFQHSDVILEPSVIHGVYRSVLRALYEPRSRSTANLPEELTTGMLRYARLVGDRDGQRLLLTSTLRDYTRTRRARSTAISLELLAELIPLAQQLEPEEQLLSTFHWLYVSPKGRRDISHHPVTLTSAILWMARKFNDVDLLRVIEHPASR